MRYLLISLLAIGLFATSCVNEDQQTVQATDRVHASDPIPMALDHEPYQIEDSLAIIRLENGVSLYFVEKGEGKMPGPNGSAEVHYEGRLKDGKIFDSSYDRAKPMRLYMEDIISGLRIALTEVPEGSKVKIMVPAPMAYGDSMPPNSIIPPNADLSFDVEVLDVR